VIAFFNSGPTSITFPIRIYSMIRFGVTPEINAIAAFVLAFSLVLIVAALALSRRRAGGRVPLGPVV
jgi:spermidine/putrescine transport system permease protein